MVAVAHDTTANWNKHRKFIPAAGEVIVYTDRSTITDSNGVVKFVPGIKIGDGKAYLVDLPFVDNNSNEIQQMHQTFQAHENNSNIHVTLEEKNFWNNKINYDISGETLIITRD